MQRFDDISRRRVGKKFVYFSYASEITDPASIERIKSLSIPPAWKEVRIAASPNAKILARGLDANGRKQAIYHPKFRARQAQQKFDRIMRFGEALPGLRTRVDADLARPKLDKEKVLATIVKLIDEAYFRVGNEQYARDNQSFGITTLRSKHTDVTRASVTFDFVGKSGKRHVKEISNVQIAKIIKKLDELPGHEIFRYRGDDGKMYDLHSSDVNAYIKEHMGEEFTAKDFRTWGGTLLATENLLAEDRPRNMGQREKIVVQTVKNVAEKLGNTPPVTRSSYIDPRVIDTFLNSTRFNEAKAALGTMRPKKHFSLDEQCVLRLLT